MKSCEKVYKLPPKFKEKWVAALRGKQFVQVSGVLHNGKNGRCCLGVAYEVAGGKWTNVNYDYVTGVETKTGNTTLLDVGDVPELVLRVLEQKPSKVFPDKYIFTTDENVQDVLAEMNDGLDRHSFKKIATIIEKYL